MQRREFLYTTAIGSLGVAAPCGGAVKHENLASHRVDAVEFREVRLLWPRHVGRNAVKGHHGHGPKVTVCRLKTDQGATGWGELQSSRNQAEALRDEVIGKPVASLINPASGVRADKLHPFDIPLHDMAGVILGQPVWRMMGADEAFLTKVYSGMIYFDDLDADDEDEGLQKVLQNCQWDYDHGYRQFKIKIGRGHQWMEPAAGLQRDIKVVRAIDQAFPDVELLVDGNNGFTVETIRAFLAGIADIALVWVEEPFHETAADWRQLAAWMEQHGFGETHRADGEAHPDFEVLEQLESDGTLTVRLTDLCGYGFTRWRRLMPRLKARGVAASPHTWGSGLKTVYTAHFAAAVGNHPTVEGVTCLADEIDFGENRIQGGQFHPSSQPGFGLTLHT